MIIRAKFPSTCPGCGERIRVGEQVEWARGTKARHVACAPGRAPTPCPDCEGEPCARHWNASRRKEGPALVRNVDYPIGSWMDDDRGYEGDY